MAKPVKGALAIRTDSRYGSVTFNIFFLRNIRRKNPVSHRPNINMNVLSVGVFCEVGEHIRIPENRYSKFLASFDDCVHIFRQQG